MFTCGLENICAPYSSQGKDYPMHGRIRTTPAEHTGAWARWELPIVCESWLLAPALDKLLPADSRLRRFRAEFVPGPAEEDAEDVYQWLFRGEKRLDRLPQTTSLQRAAKAWLEEGKKIGIGWGRLRWPE